MLTPPLWLNSEIRFMVVLLNFGRYVASFRIGLSKVAAKLRRAFPPSGVPGGSSANPEYIMLDWLLRLGIPRRRTGEGQSAHREILPRW